MNELTDLKIRNLAHLFQRNHGSIKFSDDKIFCILHTNVRSQHN